ncbi:uncharacterized protein PD653_0342 [Nocardioides sp. PD653]|nr:uncharacterized protein PD653B2_0613 [Nocardioides sp. PD653-B2]GAW52948.1 uncharacterized protein PD653_0342 [Nocardioides sp. PD653]
MFFMTLPTKLKRKSSQDAPVASNNAAVLRATLPSLRVVRGCCGTDARHVAALWGV